ncbi:MAG: ribonuclease E/G, partial [Nitrospirota bacterium]|nr:ribonuclease E/G [Nitrospirota bacterium]
MSKKMLINASHPEESRVAILEDGILQELDIEIFGKEQIKGNIYKAFVVKVEPGLQAAFVDYGGNRHGFIPFGEIQNKYYKWRDGADKSKRPRIQDVIHKGTEFLVQVVKGERDNKGASLTTYISLAGRYLVLMPGSDTAGISRKIEGEEQRKKMKELLEGLDIPDRFGVIVRTAGMGRTKQEIARDYAYLMKLWETIEFSEADVAAPSLIYQEYDLVTRMIRDYFTTEIDEILIDNKDVFRKTRDFFRALMPRYTKIVKLYQERRPIFSKYQTEEQIEKIYDQRVPLKSGGSLVINQTEALVAIDVNSGKSTSEKGVEETAFKTNMEAAEEVARQLRLRDMGGLVVIDFIDMEDRKHRHEVEKTLKNAFKADKARVQLAKISEFGLMELSRQRIKPPVSEGSYIPCPHCEAKGRVKSTEAAALGAIRKLHAQGAKKEFRSAQITLPSAVAFYLLNQKRHEIIRLENDYGMRISVLASERLLPAQFVLETERLGEGAEFIERRSVDRTPERKAAVTGAMELFLQKAAMEAGEETQIPEDETPAASSMEEIENDEQPEGEKVEGTSEGEEKAERPGRSRRSRRGRRERARKG